MKYNFTEEECLRWKQNPTQNPRTGRSISIGKDIYDTLLRKCGTIEASNKENAPKTRKKEKAFEHARELPYDLRELLYNNMLRDGKNKRLRQAIQVWDGIKLDTTSQFNTYQMTRVNYSKSTDTYRMIESGEIKIENVPSQETFVVHSFYKQELYKYGRKRVKRFPSAISGIKMNFHLHSNSINVYSGILEKGSAAFAQSNELV